MKRNLTARLRSTRTNYPPSLIVVIQARTYYDLQALYMDGRQMFDDFFFASAERCANSKMQKDRKL